MVALSEREKVSIPAHPFKEASVLQQAGEEARGELEWLGQSTAIQRDNYWLWYHFLAEDVLLKEKLPVERLLEIESFPRSGIDQREIDGFLTEIFSEVKLKEVAGEKRLALEITAVKSALQKLIAPPKELIPLPSTKPNSGSEIKINWVDI